MLSIAFSSLAWWRKFPGCSFLVMLSKLLHQLCHRRWLEIIWCPWKEGHLRITKETECWEWGHSTWLPALIQIKGCLPSEFSVRKNLPPHLISHLGRTVLSQAPPNVKSFKCFLEQQEVPPRGSFCCVISFIVELPWKLASEESGLIQIKGHRINHSELVPTMLLVHSVLDVRCLNALQKKMIYLGMDLWILVNHYWLLCLSIFYRDGLFIKNNGLFWFNTLEPGMEEPRPQHLFCFSSSVPASLLVGGRV